MHKQLQMFGFFTSKNSENKTSSKSNDKKIKYLYRKETKDSKSKKKTSRSKSAVEEKSKRQHSSQKHAADKQKHKSVDSHHKKHKKKESRSRHSSKTELYYISPEEIKKHRRSNQKSREKIVPEPKKKHATTENEDCDFCEIDRRSRKKYDEIMKLFKDYKEYKENNADGDVYQWLSKKEIFKLINSKCAPTTSGSASFLRKFFVFDQSQAQEKKVPNKADNYKNDNTNPNFVPANQSSEKNKDVNVMFARRETRQSDKKTHRSRSKDKHHSVKEKDTKTLIPPTEKPHTSETTKPKTKHKSHNKEKESVESKPKENKKVKDDNFKQPQEVFEIHDVPRMDNVNPKRHNSCLVKRTFPIVDIPPTRTFSNCPIEKKKKLKPFKKYYRYNGGEIDLGANPFSAYSDSNKMYQESSNQSVKNCERKYQRNDQTDSNLKVETHVSKIVINADEKPISRPSRDSEKKKKSVLTTQKSKIPVLTSPAKMVETIKKNLSPRNKREKTIVETKITEITPDPESKDEAVRETQNKKDKLKHNYIENRNSKQSGSKSANVKEEKQQSSELSKIPLKKLPKEPSPNKKENDLKVSPAIKSNKKEGDLQISRVTKRLSTDSKLGKKDSKLSNLSKQSDNKEKMRSKTGLLAPANRKSRSLSASPSKASNEGSIFSKGSKMTNRSVPSSKSDTRIRRNSKKSVTEQKYEKFSTRGSLSNSTFGDKSTDSSMKPASFLLTKSYKDDDKLNRWQKRKEYADTVRRNLVNSKNPKLTVPPQVMEVRYLTVTSGSITPKESGICIEDNQMLSQFNRKLEEKKSEVISVDEELKMDFFVNDLPRPITESIDQALNEILYENYNFLKKDFSYSFEIGSQNCNSEDEVASDDVTDLDKKFDEWFDLQILEDRSLSDVSCDNGDAVIDSVSGPGSEESGYSTIKSGPASKNFFERPEIKALFDPPYNTSVDSYFFEVQLQTNEIGKGVEITAAESKSLQTVFEYSQKGLQIKLSQESLMETCKETEGYLDEECLNCGHDSEEFLIGLSADYNITPIMELNEIDEESISKDKEIVIRSPELDEELDELLSECLDIIETHTIPEQNQKLEELFSECVKEANAIKNESIDLVTEINASDMKQEQKLLKVSNCFEYETIPNIPVCQECSEMINYLKVKEIGNKCKKEKQKRIKNNKHKVSFLSCLSCI